MLTSVESFRIYSIRTLKKSKFRCFSCETYRPNESYPRQQRLETPFDPNLPPLIHHITAGRYWRSMIEMIEHETNISSTFAHELMNFGSIYARNFDSQSKQETLSRVFDDIEIQPHTYIRVHENPRRYLIGNWNWKERVYPCKDGKLFIVNKPSGLPVHSSVDNVIENVIHQISSSLKLDLCVTSRLDTCTQGLVLLTNSSDYSGDINKLFISKQMKKMYKALTFKPLPLGLISHLFRTRHPKLHRNAKPTLLRRSDDGLQDRLEIDSSEWKPVELVVHQSVPRKVSELNSMAREMLDLSQAQLPLVYENHVELLTGKTHQIRLQFAAYNAPVIGDSRYDPVKGLVYQGEDTPWRDGLDLFGREPYR